MRVRVMQAGGWRSPGLVLSVIPSESMTLRLDLRRTHRHAAHMPVLFRSLAILKAVRPGAWVEVEHRRTLLHAVNVAHVLCGTGRGQPCGVDDLAPVAMSGPAGLPPVHAVPPLPGAVAMP